MKKYILDRESNKLIPWSEFVHEKTEPENVDKADLNENQKPEIKPITPEGISQDPVVVEQAFEQEPNKRELGENTESQQVSELTIPVKGDDKVVLASGSSGPPGVRKKKQNKSVKRKFKGPKLDIPDGKEPEAPPNKRMWISL